MNKKRILIFGFGYTASFLANILNQKGWSVFATGREKGKLAIIKRKDAEPILFSDEKKIEKIFNEELYILNSIPPDSGEDPLLRKYSRIIWEKKEFVKWVGYYSTTSVYGDNSGDWVTEKTIPKPKLTRSKTRLKIEKFWQDLGKENNIPINIFRLSGIYGPGRSLIDRLRLGENIVVVNRPNQLFNRVHVEDIANVTYLAMRKRINNDIFNVTDDLPASQVDVADMATKLLNLPPVKKVSLESDLISDMARSFYLEEKKVSNKKIKTKLGYRFKFPSFDVGLKDLLIKTTKV
tara:strand:+ start:1149 stop:2027 length:879 start_codon:yes stop_codon:yes gene_type:complete